MEYSTNLTDKLRITNAPTPQAGRHHVDMARSARATPNAPGRGALTRLRQRFGAVRPSAWLFATQPEHALGYLTLEDDA